jgi:hypothetical protein
MMEAVPTSETSVYYNETTHVQYPKSLSSPYLPLWEPEISQNRNHIFVSLLSLWQTGLEDISSTHCYPKHGPVCPNVCTQFIN